MSLAYRKEIDGLRTVAVLPVIFFHAGFSWFSGGFVGVDIFFVISGYLITSIIAKSLKDGTFSFKEFYVRRARRILPALFLVMLASIVIAWHVLLPEEMKSFSKSLIYVTLYASNFLFHQESGYFDLAAESKPLLHTWSLSIEEQFYLFFPLLMLGIWRWGQTNVRVIVFVLMIVSFLLAIFNNTNHPSASFYLIHTRAWELLAGSLLALYMKDSEQINISPSVKQVLSLSGFALIALSIFTFDKYTPFPGTYTLVPVLGTCLIILCANPHNWIGQLLSLRLLVGIGLISYSLYLWHQPIFVFLRQSQLEELGTNTYLLAIGLVFLLSYLSWRYVEMPIRKTHVSRKYILGALLGFSLLFIILGIYGNQKKGFHDRFNLPPEIERIISDSSYMGCDSAKTEAPCHVGHIKRERTDILIVGDSHSGVILPAFDLVGKNNGLKISRIGGGGCPPLLGVYLLKGHNHPAHCADLAKKQLDFASSQKVSHVIMIAYWNTYVNDANLGSDPQAKRSQSSSLNAFKAGLEKTIHAYEGLGIKVSVMYQVPEQIMSPKQIYYLLYQKDRGQEVMTNILNKYSITKAQHLSAQQLARELIAEKTSNIINVDEALCHDQICLAGTAVTPFYRDKNHVSKPGAALITPILERQLKTKY